MAPLCKGVWGFRLDQQGRGLRFVCVRAEVCNKGRRCLGCGYAVVVGYRRHRRSAAPPQISLLPQVSYDCTNRSGRQRLLLFVHPRAGGPRHWWLGEASSSDCELFPWGARCKHTSALKPKGLLTRFPPVRIAYSLMRKTYQLLRKDLLTVLRSCGSIHLNGSPVDCLMRLRVMSIEFMRFPVGDPILSC